MKPPVWPAPIFGSASVQEVGATFAQSSVRSSGFRWVTFLPPDAQRSRLASSPPCLQSAVPPVRRASKLAFPFPPLHVNAVSRQGESVQNEGNSDYSFGKEFTPRYAAETAIPTLESPGHIASQGETLYKSAQSGTMLIINRVSKACFRDIPRFRDIL